MHILNRLLTLVLCLAVLIPLGTSALVSMDDRDETRSSLRDAIDTAVVRYRQRTGLQALQTKNAQVVKEEADKLPALTRRKRELRFEIASKLRVIDVIEGRYAVELSSIEQVDALIEQEKQRLSRLLSRRYREQIVQGKEKVVRTVVEGVTDSPVTDEVLERVQMKFLKDLIAGKHTLEKLAVLESERETVLTAYWKSQRAYDQAEQVVERSADQLTQIQEIMADVHEQVLKIQGELARIDARLRAKSERALIEKGLLDPAHAKDRSLSASVPLFSWPVYGTVSAGFRNESYKKYFGVPHDGVDIVVGENTPVAAAADGVVFLVRDGGAKGYTYVLVGHRGGYATLYGHLLSVNVVAGQEVAPGDVIGMSGGRPGTRGAGPMTTGAHLHFEVIQAGVNIDPTSVLP